MTLDAYLKLLTALVSLVLAGLLVAVGRQRATARVLGAFLFLICANQAAEAVRATPGADDLLAFRVASIAASLDPLFFLVFVAVFPGERPFPWRTVAVTAVGSAILALWAGWFLFETPVPFAAGSAYPLALTLFTATVYLGVLGHALARMLREPDVLGWRYLFPALAVVAIPLVPRLIAATWAVLPFAPATSYLDIVAVTAGSVLVAAAVLVARARHAAGPQAAVARRSVLLASLLALLMLAPQLALAIGTLGVPMGPTASALGRSEAPVRWLLFGVLASMAIFRADPLGLPVARRRWAARVVCGLAVAVAGAAALLGLRQVAGLDELHPVELLLIGGAVFLSQGFQRVNDRIAARVYGVPSARDPAAARSLYEETAAAWAQGRVDDAALARLRADLELDAQTAELIERRAAEASARPLAVGHSIAGRYRVLSLLGRGGEGRVFLAEDAIIRRRVVVKEVLLADLEGSEGALGEARAIGALQHPHILTLHDVLRTPRALLLLTEYVEGGSLGERVRARGPLPLPDALRLVDGVLDALEHVHARGFVHRDIKPDNILLTPTGEPKLADFGIARLHKAVTEALGAAPGTPEWMAPEQRRGLRVGPQADVYGIGLVLARCVQGPLPPPLAAVVERAIAEPPDARWPDAAALRAALLAAQRQ